MRVGECSLLARIRRIGVGCIAVHAVVDDVARLCDDVAPEGRRLDAEVLDDSAGDVR